MDRVSGVKLTKDQCQTIANAVIENILFADLTEELTSSSWADHKLFKCLTRSHPFKAGQPIVTQGEDGEKVKYFYIIDHGACEVKVGSKVVAQLGTAEGQTRSFGELALMYQSPRAATVTATEETVVWQMDREAFHALLVDRASQQLKSWEDFVMESVPLLKPLPKAERQRFTEGEGFEAVYRKGDYIFNEGEIADKMYVLESGQLSVMKSGTTQVSEKINTIGEFFGHVRKGLSADKASNGKHQFRQNFAVRHNSQPALHF